MRILVVDLASVVTWYRGGRERRRRRSSPRRRGACEPPLDLVPLPSLSTEMSSASKYAGLPDIVRPSSPLAAVRPRRAHTLLSRSTGLCSRRVRDTRRTIRAQHSRTLLYHFSAAHPQPAHLLSLSPLTARLRLGFRPPAGLIPFLHSSWSTSYSNTRQREYQRLSVRHW